MSSAPTPSGWNSPARRFQDSDRSPADSAPTPNGWKPCRRRRSTRPFRRTQSPAFCSSIRPGTAQDRLNSAIVGDAQDATGFRRARLAVLGKVAPKTLYQIEVDFAAAGRPSFFDNYVEQEALPCLGAIRAGQYLQPFSADAMSGFRNLPFLERSLPFLAFVPFRRVGVMASNNSEDERTYWAYSGYKTGGFNSAPMGDSQFATDIGNVGGYSFSTRLTHLLVYEGKSSCGTWEPPTISATSGRMTPKEAEPQVMPAAARTPSIRPRRLPNSVRSARCRIPRASAVRSISRRRSSIPAAMRPHSFNLVGLETVFQNGPFSFQSEWMLTEVNSVVGPIVYHGAYAECLYRLTGETRGYDKKLAALKNVVPDHDFISFGRDKTGEMGLGAWEIAGRASYVELRNPNSLSGHYYDSTTNLYNAPASKGAVGNGTLTDTTLGLTWFLNAHAKFQFNWIHAFLNNSSPVKPHGFSQADMFVTRMQVDF